MQATFLIFLDTSTKVVTHTKFEVAADTLKSKKVFGCRHRYLEFGRLIWVLIFKYTKLI